MPPRKGSAIADLLVGDFEIWGQVFENRKARVHILDYGDELPSGTEFAARIRHELARTKGGVLGVPMPSAGLELGRLID